jgi:hypothetical protein
MTKAARNAASHLQKFDPDASRVQAAIVGGTGNRSVRTCASLIVHGGFDRAYLHFVAFCSALLLAANTSIWSVTIASHPASSIAH